MLKSYSTAKILPRGPGQMAAGWQHTPLLIRGPKCILFRNQPTSDTLLNTSITSGFVSRTIGSTAILSLFHTHSKVSIFLSSLRTSESVESLNVRINTRLDICPFRSMNQLDQLHLRLLPMWRHATNYADTVDTSGFDCNSHHQNT